MLTEKEIKGNSIIMIEFVSGESKMFYVHTKRTSNITGATMLLGYLLEDMVESAQKLGPESVWPIIDKGQTDRYYIENENKKGNDERVKEYRAITGVEKMQAQVLLINNKLSAVAPCLN